MSRRRKYRRLVAAALAAGLLAAPTASARTPEPVRPAGSELTRPQPAPDADGPHAWLALIGLTGVAVAAGGTAGVRPRRVA
jgi:hypothetical protein